jgi:hypothetical protein
LLRDVEIVNMRVPVLADLFNRRHGKNYIGCPR